MNRELIEKEIQRRNLLRSGVTLEKIEGFHPNLKFLNGAWAYIRSNYRFETIYLIEFASGK